MTKWKARHKTGKNIGGVAPEVSALIESINSKRKQKFKEIAANNNTSLQAVEQLAGKKAIEKSAPGSYVKVGGSWQKK